MMNNHLAVSLGSPAMLLCDMACRLKFQGKIQEAIKLYEQAISENRDFSPAYYNLGVLYSEQGDVENAFQCYMRCVEVNPAYAEAYCNLGVLYKGSGDLASARACYEQCLMLKPSFQIARSNLAIVLCEQARSMEMSAARATYRRALLYNPACAEAYYNLGVIASIQKKPETAQRNYELAIHFNPYNGEAHNNLGILLKEQGNLERAEECYRTALFVNPTFSPALNNLAMIQTMMGRLSEAKASLQLALMNGEEVDAYNNYGVLSRDEGAITTAISCYRKALQLDINARNAGQNLLLALNYLPLPLSQIYEEHCDWGRRFESLYSPYTEFANSRTADRPLVVGYLSPDFFTHSVSYFVEGVLRAHTDKLRVFCYSNVAQEDSRTVEFRTLIGSGWRQVSGLSAAQVAEQVRADGVDILVELAGHTAHNLLDVLALRPAPIQVLWVGYPNTSGMTRVDYRLTDEYCDPTDSKQEHTERLLRLPRCFLCYAPPPAPVPAPTPCLANGHFTFGSFNNLAKMTREVLEVWSRLLRALPGSRLVLKSRALADEAVRNTVLEVFLRDGISPGRLDLHGLQARTQDHLAMYSLIDLNLDTFPYAGTTTTCEAHWMGVPTVALRGDRHCQNVAVSLLNQVGLENLVADTPEQYIEKALALARKPAALNELRLGLRERMKNSYLCNAPEFTKNLEAAYAEMWKEYLAADADGPERQAANPAKVQRTEEDLCVTG